MVHRTARKAAALSLAVPGPPEAGLVARPSGPRVPPAWAVSDHGLFLFLISLYFTFLFSSSIIDKVQQFHEPLQRTDFCFLDPFCYVAVLNFDFCLYFYILPFL